MNHHTWVELRVVAHPSTAPQCVQLIHALLVLASVFLTTEIQAEMLFFQSFASPLTEVVATPAKALRFPATVQSRFLKRTMDMRLSESGTLCMARFMRNHARLSEQWCSLRPLEPLATGLHCTMRNGHCTSQNVLRVNFFLFFGPFLSRTKQKHYHCIALRKNNCGLGEGVGVCTTLGGGSNMKRKPRNFDHPHKCGFLFHQVCPHLSYLKSAHLANLTQI